MSEHSLHLSIRPRRLRKSVWLRGLVAEHQLSAADLIWPLFVQEGHGLATPIPTLPGVNRLTIDLIVDAAKEAAALGIPAIALFPVTLTNLKTEDGAEAHNQDNLVCRAIRAVKSAVPNLGVIGDVALDPYTTHGHDGVLNAAGEVDNDATIAILCQQAIALAAAGCDIVAPSDMMDGRIGAIRAALEEAGHQDTAILSYAAKYASALYGPFRAAVGSGQAQPLDKRGYQMNPANTREAMHEASLDIEEGADMLMVKPATLYLDIIARVAEISPVPVFAYHVSGEYAMLKAAVAAGIVEEQKVTFETLLAIKRAGATAILTYAARDVAEWLSQ